MRLVWTWDVHVHSQHNEHSAQEDNAERHHFESQESLAQEDDGEECGDEGTQGPEDRHDANVTLVGSGKVAMFPSASAKPAPATTATMRPVSPTGECLAPTSTTMRVTAT